MGVRGRVDRRGMQQGARGAHKRACVGRTGRHSAGRVAGGAGAQHKRSAGSGARGAARRGGAGARDLAHRHSGHGRLGGTGAQPLRTGWASWVLMHPAWFSTSFFDSVFFLSH